jgi:hypothetical protein
MPNSLPEVEAQAALPPHQAVAPSTGRTNEEMVREEFPPHEAMAVTQEEALAVGGEAAGATLAGVVSQEVPATLALTRAADLSHGGRASPSLAQTGGELPAWGGARDSRDPVAAILALSDEKEDTEWQGISEALSATLGALRDVVILTCQVWHLGLHVPRALPGHF